MKSFNLKTLDDHSSYIFYLFSKPAFLVFLVFVVQSINATVTPLHSVKNTGIDTDRVALLAIKSNLVASPDQVLRSWNDSVHHCSWEGVTCGHKHDRVSVLDLNTRGLAGTISPFIGNLSFLKIIRLSNNSLYGKIPEQLTHITKLQELGLENNTLVGEIPANISRCVNLRYISLGHNKLVGELPAGMRALSELRNLSVHNNNLTGPLFDIIQNLTSLAYIAAISNSFTGTVPDSIGRMRNLTYLRVSQNQLTGTLPISLFNLSSLQIFDVFDNHLHGELPASMGFTLPRLRWLHLARNNFSGSIPITINNLTNLESIRLQENAFTGKLPHDFGHFHNLTRLDLSKNNLVGDINFITTLVNCSQLNTLALNENDFSGRLPQSVANLSTTLAWLFIGDSSLSGTFPAGITNLINLEHLSMYNSQLTASIPHDFGKLQNLQVVDLSSNRLTGKIPSSVGNLSRLSMFYLHDNILEGSIPESIGNCRSLLWLDLRNNHFSGNIPSQLFGGSAKFVGMYLSQNNLEGSLPFEISKQTNLVDLEIFNNKLSSLIPDGLSECPTLQYLYMEGNSFHGHIPPSLASLTSLVEVDVSRNHLSGQIPAYLSKFPLIYLNLSYNDFEGPVPATGVFANASRVSLVGNDGLCGGIRELLLTKCAENKTMERNNRSMSYALKKAVISTVCVIIGVLAVSIGMYLIYRRRKSEPVSSTSITGKEFTKVSYDMLLKATSGFSSENLLGAGSFGSVFKGVLEGKMIAVKVLNLQHLGASKSFLAECKTLRSVRHRNLVGIITACSSIDFQRNDFRALVYEFMPNRSLDRWIYGAVGNMSLQQRVDIAIDVAHALNYLHHECETPIVHCDLKPSNILLDNDMVARVGDFGLSKFLTQPQHPNQSSTIGIRGTIGYAAPEYGLGSEASTDGDVYSYGILLLELMTGKSPTDSMFKEEYNLHMYAEEALPDQVLHIVDPSLDEDYLTDDEDNSKTVKNELQRKMECVISVISVGVSCSNHFPKDRMKITDARSRLQSARDNLLNARKRRNLPAKGHEDDFIQETSTQRSIKI